VSNEGWMVRFTEGTEMVREVGFTEGLFVGSVEGTSAGWFDR